MYQHGSTNMAKAWEFVRNDMFSEQHGARPNVEHIALIITDGESDDPNEAIDEVSELLSHSATIPC